MTAGAPSVHSTCAVTFEPLAADRDAAGVQANADAFLLEQIPDGPGNVRILPSDERRSHLDDRDLTSEAPEHLAELEADVAPADDDEVLGQDAQVHHRAVREKRGAIDAGQFRDRGTTADVDEDAVGAEEGLTNRDLPCRAEAGVAPEHVALLEALQHLLEALSRLGGDCVLAGLDARDVHTDPAIDGHTIVSGAARKMGCIGTGDHGLRRDAACIHAGATDEMPFDNRHAHPFAAQAAGERRPGLAGSDDDGVVRRVHVVPLGDPGRIRVRFRNRRSHERTIRSRGCRTRETRGRNLRDSAAQAL